MRGETMWKKVLFAGAASIIAAAWVPGLSAQQLGPAPELGEDVANVSLHLGMLAPTTKFDDPVGGQSSLESGLAIGVSATGWLFERIGVRAKVMRSSHSGHNDTFPFAPLATQDATVWILTAEGVYRIPMEIGSLSGFPYAALGAGGKQYTWSRSLHDEDRDFALTGAAGVDLRTESFGRFGLNAELRAYRSSFNNFGINGGNWRVGTQANELEPVGFYGGVTDDVTNWDVLFTTGITVSF